MTMDLSKYQFHATLQVRDYEIDAEGIVNNAVYLHYMEHTRHLFCREAGFSFAQMRSAGIDPVAARIEIDYKTPLRSGDEMVSCLNISRRGPVYVFDQDIYRADATLCARGRVMIACIKDGKLTRGDELALAFKDYIN
ncbi:MAG: acyl-CoA thioesterase [Muribaculaceae bacterium]